MLCAVGWLYEEGNCELRPYSITDRRDRIGQKADSCTGHTRISGALCAVGKDSAPFSASIECAKPSSVHEQLCRAASADRRPRDQERKTRTLELDSGEADTRVYCRQLRAMGDDGGCGLG
jgi:hypothetical protein